MKKEMITVYRRSSPRTGRVYDTRMILSRDLKFYLNAGYTKTPPKKIEDTIDVDIIPPSMLNAEQIEEIREKSGSYKELADFFSVSASTVQRIKQGKL